METHDTAATAAEEIGLTFEEARAIAQVACDAAEAGDLEASRTVLESLVALNPRDSAVLAALGTVYQKLGLLSEAEATYSVAIDLGGHSLARINRAELRLMRSDSRGVDDLEVLVHADPAASRGPAARAHRLLGLHQRTHTRTRKA